MAMSVNDWQRATTRGTTSEKEGKRVTNSDNELQWVTASESSGTVNENGTVHFKEWWFQWQKEINYYFEGWMAAIRAAK